MASLTCIQNGDVVVDECSDSVVTEGVVASGVVVDVVYSVVANSEDCVVSLDSVLCIVVVVS